MIEYRNIDNYYFLLVPLVGALVIYIYVFQSDRKKVLSILKSVFNLQSFKRSLREERMVHGFIPNMLMLASVLSLSSSITYMLYSHWMLLEYKPALITLWLIVLGSISVLLMTAFLLEWILKVLTSEEKLIRDIAIYQKFFFIAIGMVLMPFLFFLNFHSSPSDEYYEAFFYKGVNLVIISCFLALYLWRILQVLRQTLPYNVSSYYLFLYFCTLEILPLVVLGTWLVG